MQRAHTDKSFINPGLSGRLRVIICLVVSGSSALEALRPLSRFTALKAEVQLIHSALNSFTSCLIKVFYFDFTSHRGFLALLFYSEVTCCVAPDQAERLWTNCVYNPNFNQFFLHVFHPTLPI